MFQNHSSTTSVISINLSNFYTLVIFYQNVSRRFVSIFELTDQTSSAYERALYVQMHKSLFIPSFLHPFTVEPNTLWISLLYPYAPKIIRFLKFITCQRMRGCKNCKINKIGGGIKRYYSAKGAKSVTISTGREDFETV